MSAAQKSECPAATGQIAEQTKDAQILFPAQEIGNPGKQFATLQAAFALRGHRLERTFHGADTAPTFYSERWGVVRHLPTLEDVRRFLAQIGGAV